ncbi:hypothetical protein KTF37_30770, partial [Burkholderia multivorans]
MTERAMGVTRACGLVGISRSLFHVSAEVILTPGAEVKLTPWAMMAAFGRQDVDPGAIIGDSSTGP